MLLFQHMKTDVHTLALSIGKEYLMEVVHTFVKNEKILENINIDINELIHTISDKKLLRNFIVPIDIMNVLRVDKYRIELGHIIDNYDRIVDDWNNSYNFYSYLIEYMYQASKMFDTDKKSDKMHLCFSYKPKEPSNYNGLEDIKPTYNSILAKFSYKAYKKYTQHNGNCEEGCAYFFAFTCLYLVSKLYNILKPYIEDVNNFLKYSLTSLNPTIVGLVLSSKYSLGNVKVMTVISELAQLKADTPNLLIVNNNTSIKLTYISRGTSFTHKRYEATYPNFRSDNTGKRNVSITILGKDNDLEIKTDIVGLSNIKSIWGVASDKDMFGTLSIENFRDSMTRHVLSTMLSHTEQYNNAQKQAMVQIEKLYPKSIVFAASTPYQTTHLRDEYLNNLRYSLIKQNIFKDLSSETVSKKIELLHGKFHLNKYSMDYYITAIELESKDNSVIKKVLQGIGSKQQATIRKMIATLREASKEPTYALNKIYNRLFD